MYFPSVKCIKFVYWLLTTYRRSPRPRPLARGESDKVVALVLELVATQTVPKGAYKYNWCQKTPLSRHLALASYGSGPI